MTSTVTAGKAQDCVLLIEDNEEAMWLVKDALQRYSNERFTLEWAQDLSSGLLYLSKNNAAIVLLDIGLPDSSGSSSFASVRKIAPDVPVLVLTADDRPETERELTTSGTHDYLVKDEVSGPLLVQAINAALYQGKSRTE
jgi:DNA-binding response OmpR family regulator